MAGRLEGKVAIVTGASRGIGAAIARAFAAEGAARVIISSRKLAGLEAQAEAIHADYPDTVSPRTCHMGDEAQITALIDWVESEYGTPQILINNAGTNPYFGPMLGTTRAAWDKTFDVNLRGPFEAARQVSQRLIAKGLPGSIVNVTSILGQGASPLQGAYGMTKAALISMTRTLAMELGGYNIRVNAIAPGLIETKLSAALTGSPDVLKPFMDRTPLGRVGEPDELAGAAVFLASDESRYVTGHTLNVDGGYKIT